MLVDSIKPFKEGLVVVVFIGFWFLSCLFFRDEEAVEHPAQGREDRDKGNEEVGALGEALGEGL